MIVPSLNCDITNKRESENIQPVKQFEYFHFFIFTANIEGVEVVNGFKLEQQHAE